MQPTNRTVQPTVRDRYRQPIVDWSLLVAWDDERAGRISGSPISDSHPALPRSRTPRYHCRRMDHSRATLKPDDHGVVDAPAKSYGKLALGLGALAIALS